VRGLHVADPDLGIKPLLAKLRVQQLDLRAGTSEVREALKVLKALKALTALKAENEAAAAISAPLAANEGDDLLNAFLSHDLLSALPWAIDATARPGPGLPSPVGAGRLPQALELPGPPSALESYQGPQVRRAPK